MSRESSIRMTTLACLVASLPACMSQAANDRRIERELAPHHSSCLATGVPAYTQQHTNCVIDRYAAHQREWDRRRAAVDPPFHPAEFETPED
jgi:hypothetical protein